MVSPWRMNLQPASYNGAGFFVDVDARSGGRRIALHEYPKRDDPYAEDMGRRARRFSITAYVIGPNFTAARDALIEQLEADRPGMLIRPTTVADMLVVVDTYNITERRERGGTATFEITFIEAGINTSSIMTDDTQANVNSAVNAAVPGAFAASSDMDLTK